MVTKEQTPDAVQAVQHGGESRRACLFTVCGEVLAIDVEHLYEVVQEAIITPLPQVPLGLAGLVNFRGEILPVIELAPWLTSNSRSGDDTVQVMVVHGDGKQLGLRIDGVRDVAEYRELRPADGEILRPGLETCLKPVAAASFHTLNSAATGTIWHLLVSSLFDRITELFSRPRTDYERAH